VRDNGKELIPGKLATARNRAFFSAEGKEHETHNYKMVTGTIMAKNEEPDEADAVGFSAEGKYYIGISDGSSHVSTPGKVKDGTLYYGKSGKEHQTKDFYYVKVSHIDG
jgi:hypothetical protein